MQKKKIQIEQLVYTKVPQEISPWQRTDFHTVFYPVGLLTPADVREIEQKIHIPDLERITAKKTVFFHRLHDRDYLVMLCLKNLPRAKDSFGRGGMFLVHGFLFPPPAWHEFSPADLFHLVQNSIFQSPEKIIASPMIDRETGNIAPIVIEKKTVTTMSDVPFTLSATQRKVVQILIDMARGLDADLLIHGNADQVFSCMSTLFAAIPDALKISLGWDDVYENGNMHFFPLSIAGFQNRPPTSGNAVVMDATSCSIEENPDTASVLPRTSFQRWLLARPGSTYSRSLIEDAHALSLVVDNGKPAGPGTTLPAPDLACFVQENRQAILEAFTEKCEQLAGKEICSLLVPLCSADNMLELLAEGMVLGQLAARITDLVYSSGFEPRRPLPDLLASSGGTELRILNKLWQSRQLSASEFVRLDMESRARVFTYLLQGKWKKESWPADLLGTIDGLFDRLAASQTTQAGLKNILVTFLSARKTCKPVAEIIASEAILQKRGAALLQQAICGEDIVETALQEERFDLNQLKTLARWVKNEKIALKGPWMRTFFAPEATIPEEVMNTPASKSLLLPFLLSFHKFDGKKLRLLGFIDREISLAASLVPKQSMIGRIKNLLSTRR